MIDNLLNHSGVYITTPNTKVSKVVMRIGSSALPRFFTLETLVIAELARYKTLNAVHCVDDVRDARFKPPRHSAKAPIDHGLFSFSSGFRQSKFKGRATRSS